jgi:hypothetical protein
MPGLAAIELVMLALPWSLLLGASGLRQSGWVLMTLVVLGAVLKYCDALCDRPHLTAQAR